MKPALPGLIDWLDARVNPILVKEMYQGLRGRALLATGALALFGPLFFYLAIVLAAGEGNEAGESYFAIVVMAMGIATIFAIPISANRMLVGEMQTGTMELIALTRLSPWQIVSGRFAGALMKSTLIIALMAPFTVAAILMGATGSETVLLVLLINAVLTTVGTGFALLLGSLANISSKLSNLFSLGYFGFCFMSAGILGQLLFRAGWLSSLQWETVVWMLALVILLTVLSLRLGADMLTMAHVRTYAPSRAALFSVVLVFASRIGVDRLWFGRSFGNEGDELLGVGLAATALMCALLAAADEEPDGFEGQWSYVFQNRQDAHLMYSAVLFSIFGLAALPYGDAPLFFYWGGCLYLGLAVALSLRKLLRRRTSPLMFFLMLALVGFIQIVGTTSHFSQRLFGVFVPLKSWHVFFPVIITDRWEEWAQSRFWMAVPFVAGLFLTYLHVFLRQRRVQAVERSA